jgi:hypothetical protein
MAALPRLPSIGAGPKSTVCEVQRWVTVPIAEAIEAKERYLSVHGQMSKDQETLCEVFRWVTVTIDEALRKGERGRCVECKEPVRAHRGSVDGMAPHFEHLARNPNCSRSDNR